MSKYSRYIDAEELKNILNASKYYGTKAGRDFADMITECSTADVQKIPCKVGDMVYVIDGHVRETKVVTIHQLVSGHWKIITEEPHTTPYWKGYELPFDAFGKTVFCTPEEAEAALKKFEVWEDKQ